VTYNDPVSGQASNLDAETSAVGMYLYDKLANPVGVLSDAGAREYAVSYDPYGAPTVASGGDSLWYQYTPYGFKAGTRTANEALLKFGLRWYLPSTGTWTQRDTLDAPLDPTNANRYAYAGNDPANNDDVSGTVARILVQATCAVGVAAAVIVPSTLIGAFGTAGSCQTAYEDTIACDRLSGEDRASGAAYGNSNYSRPCSNPFGDTIG
jgi:RHS repeat-associated protein